MQGYNKVTLVCYAKEVEGLSSRGFKLKEVVYSDQVVLGDETVTIRDPNYHHNTSTDRNSKPFLARIPMFVMTQTGDQALAEKQVIIEDFRARLRTGEDDLGKAVKEASEQKARADMLGEKLVQSNTYANKLNAGNDELRAKQAKLEGDLGKVRAAIGELRMKEIIG